MPDTTSTFTVSPPRPAAVPARSRSRAHAGSAGRERSRTPRTRRSRRAPRLRPRSHPTRAPNATTSGTSTTVSRPCAQMRRFGRPIETGKLFVQPNTNCSAPAITIRRSASVAPTILFREEQPDEIGRKPEQDGHGDESARSGAERVTAHPCEHGATRAALPVPRLLREEDQPSGRRQRGESLGCGACATRKYATCGGDDTRPRSNGLSVLQRDDARRNARLHHEANDLADARRRSKSREPADSAGTQPNPRQGQRSWRTPARRPSPRSSPSARSESRSRSPRAAAPSREKRKNARMS